jgi:hypothetical protein
LRKGRLALEDLLSQCFVAAGFKWSLDSTHQHSDPSKVEEYTDLVIYAFVEYDTKGPPIDFSGISLAAVDIRGKVS